MRHLSFAWLCRNTERQILNKNEIANAVLLNSLSFQCWFREEEVVYAVLHLFN